MIDFPDGTVIRRIFHKFRVDSPCFITKGALATDSFNWVEHDGYFGRN